MLEPNTPKHFRSFAGIFRFTNSRAQEYWNKLFSSAPRGLRYALKIPEEITVKSFPKHPRYGPRAGDDNPAFLNAAIFPPCFSTCCVPGSSKSQF